MDGTLLRVDTLHENLLVFLRQHFWQAWRWIAWLFRGKASFKQQLASCVPVEIENLPACEELVQFLRAEHGRGRRLVLATAADEQIRDSNSFWVLSTPSRSALLITKTSPISIIPALIA
jgi:hypothetical protein